jgi:hypothetical protein
MNLQGHTISTNFENDILTIGISKRKIAGVKKYANK